MSKVIFDKITKIMHGELVVMSDEELDWIEANDDGQCAIFYASAPNPNQVGVLDKWVVGKKDHPYMIEFKNK